MQIWTIITTTAWFISALLWREDCGPQAEVIWDPQCLGHPERDSSWLNCAVQEGMHLLKTPEKCNVAMGQSKEEGDKGGPLFLSWSVRLLMKKCGQVVSNFCSCLTSPTCTTGMVLPPYFISQLPIQQRFRYLTQLAWIIHAKPIFF